METKPATPSTSSANKRKAEIATQILKSPPPPPYAQLNKKPRRRVVSVSKIVPENGGVLEVKDADDAVCVSPRSSSGSDHVEEASCCSSNGSSELVEDGNMEFVDLEDDDHDDESDEVESRTYNPLAERREMTPSSDLQPQSTAAEPRRGSSTAEKMPTELELEEFFTAAEKDIQNKFSQKYNYDIVKDAPLDGRYEWVRLKP